MPAKCSSARTDHTKEIYGIIFLAVGSFIGLCLYSYHPLDPSLSSLGSGDPIHNLGGVVGSYLADFLYMIFGLGAYCAPLLLALVAFSHFAMKKISFHWSRLIGYGSFLAFAAIFFQLAIPEVSLEGQMIRSGGLVGWSLAGLLTRYLGNSGTYLLVGAGLLLTLLWLTQISLAQSLGWLRRFVVLAVRRLFGASQIAWNRWTRWAGKKREALMAASRRQWRAWQMKRQQRHEKEVRPDPEMSELKELVVKAPAKVTPIRSVPQPTTQASRETSAEPTVSQRKDLPSKNRRASEQLQMVTMNDDFELPQLSYLDSNARQQPKAIDERALKMNARVLEKKLQDFGVEGQVLAIHPGPVITMYEFEPAPGVKINKIANLGDDLSVIMGGKSVRVVPHLPGKAAIGIEIPNSDRETVWLKDIIGNAKFQKAESKLVLAVGKDSEGYPAIADLAKMPHLLIAGATGAGKSVALNAMICSILYKATPEEVRMILVDPKMLELSIYEKIPHLLLPVVTEPAKASQALRWAVREMERRYHLMMNAGIRDIVSYNKKLDRGELDVETVITFGREELRHENKLPHLVIVIDELADIMMTCSKDLEDGIMRLAQKARAAGIHLILATQRPSVDVITGVIKANFPARMSFKVSSRHDSRTILDRIGAERLLGQGDMLFLPPNASELKRIHGAFVTETEIQRVVKHLRQQGSPVYRDDILAPEPEDAFGPGGESGEEDELYDRAVNLVAESKQASISMIQRHLRIGYNRAARMIERMEQEGVVGPADGSKPRKVLVQDFVEQ